MNVITRYLVFHLLRMGFLCLAAWLGLFAFFDMIHELAAIGGEYRLVSMMTFVALSVPGHAYELMPISALIGGLLGLSMLNQNSEYTVMRISGVSVSKVVAVLALTGAIFASFTLLLGEMVVPFSERMGQQLKLAASGKVVAQDLRSGFWAKDGSDFINVHEFLPDGTLRGVTILDFDSNRRMTRYVYAQVGHWVKDQDWVLERVYTHEFGAASVDTIFVPTLSWHSVLNKDTLSILLIEPDKMSAMSLGRYITYLRVNNQDTQRYQIALWSKLFYPLACVSMLIIALPFAQGQRRAGGIGIKLFTGVMLGLAFYFVNKFTSTMGQLKGWSPFLSATVPSVAFFVAAMLMLWKQERR